MTRNLTLSLSAANGIGCCTHYTASSVSVQSTNSLIHAYALLLSFHVFGQTGSGVGCLTPPPVRQIKMGLFQWILFPRTQQAKLWALSLHYLLPPERQTWKQWISVVTVFVVTRQTYRTSVYWLQSGHFYYYAPPRRSAGTEASKEARNSNRVVGSLMRTGLRFVCESWCRCPTRMSVLFDPVYLEQKLKNAAELSWGINRYTRHISTRSIRSFDTFHLATAVNCRKNVLIWLKYRYTRHTRNACYI